MKVSELWLREWVNPSLDEQKIAELLTMSGLEIDAVNPVAGEFDKVIVAYVVSTKPHPQADRLTLCEIETGQGHPLQVVCGAANVRAGLKVALAQIGANLPHGMKIKETKLRGELSQGMLCSASELGLVDEVSEGIIELDEDAPLGANLRDYLLLNDHIFDIDLTPNRADCFSVLGIARELSALTKIPLKQIQKKINPPTIDESLTVQIEAKEACPIYTGRIIRGIDMQTETPTWMCERLRRSGLRPINPVVDVTNYVMLELGQPMHAFDLQKIKGGIITRFSKDGETVKLLDGQQVSLNGQVLVIADHEKTLALAGVMGSEESSVQETTTEVFLESAFFNPLTIAGIARRFGVVSDSAQRFERGVDPSLQVFALERATELLKDIVGGDIGPIISASEAEFIPERHQVSLNPTKVKKLIGITIAEDEMMSMLQGLGMQVDNTNAVWRVDIPSHRFDIIQEADLIEEIIRLYGYDRLPGEKMVAPVEAGTIHPFEALTMRISHFFNARGYNETISYSFVDPELQQELYPGAEAMQLLNPISSELSQMRIGLWPGLIAAMIYNIHRQQTAIKFFEHGVVFDLQQGVLAEHPSVAGLLTGEQGTMNWSETSGKFDFFDLKGDLEALLSVLDQNDVQFVATTHPAFHPGKSAAIHINGQPAGLCGVLHPRLADALELQDEIILFELRLNALINKTPVRYQQISKFPQIRRDLSFLVNNEVSAGQIETTVRQAVSKDLLKGFHVFDVYTGKSVPDDKKSLAIALILQDDKRTMVDSEINAVIDAIIKTLNDNFSIILRD